MVRRMKTSRRLWIDSWPGCKTVGGSEKKGHHGAEVVPGSIAIQAEAFLSSQEVFFRTARSCQGRAVVGRGEAHP
jgi:hypothetical protein